MDLQYIHGQLTMIKLPCRLRCYKITRLQQVTAFLMQARYSGEAGTEQKRKWRTCQLQVGRNIFNHSYYRNLYSCYQKLDPWSCKVNLESSQIFIGYQTIRIYLQDRVCRLWRYSWLCCGCFRYSAGKITEVHDNLRPSRTCVPSSWRWPGWHNNQRLLWRDPQLKLGYEASMIWIATASSCKFTIISYIAIAAYSIGCRYPPTNIAPPRKVEDDFLFGKRCHTILEGSIDFIIRADASFLALFLRIRAFFLHGCGKQRHKAVRSVEPSDLQFVSNFPDLWQSSG